MEFLACQVAPQIKNLAASNHMSWFLKCVYIYTHTHIYRASLVAQMVRESACNAEDPGSIAGSGRSPREWLTSVLAWRIPWTELPGGLQSLGHKELDMTEWLTLSLSHAYICRREWHLTPIFLPEEFHRQRILAGYSPWGCRESDTTEWLAHTYK